MPKAAPSSEQVWPSPKQRPPRQQPAPSHLLPGQQASPAAPQRAQMPEVHTVPAPHWTVPGQHISPGPPQDTQVPPAPTAEQRVSSS
jgi:hypothetical protein